MTVSKVTLIGTCPTFRADQTAAEYHASVLRATLLAESQGWVALLVYSDHRQMDPWVVAQAILGAETSVSPLVALQPLYMHPFTVAKLMASLSFTFDRPVHINFVSGGVPRDLESLCDSCEHDERYNRIVEYGTIIRHVLFEKTPLTFEGRYFRLKALHLAPWPALKPHCKPMMTISGSSPAGLAAAKKLDACAIEYLRPPRDYTYASFDPSLRHGVRLGVIARPEGQEAWRVAKLRFPENQLGIEARKRFAKTSDSVWVKELSRAETAAEGEPYWLGPYQCGHASCPFLVGSIEDVAGVLAEYIRLGFQTFLLESPDSDEDAARITEAFQMAVRLSQAERLCRPATATPSDREWTLRV